MREPVEIIDLSQPVTARTACFPGDVPFSSEITVSYAASQVMNLCAFTMSPHVGTHADAPIHIRGDLAQPDAQTLAIGEVSLSPYIGPAVVVDVSPHHQAITLAQVEKALATLAEPPRRVLFKTRPALCYDVFETDYAWLSPGLIERLADGGVMLVGLDTPSVDAVDSKTLETHHALVKHGMAWLENLDFSRLNGAFPQTGFLVAAPLRFTALEASPVRAALLRF